MQIPVVSFGDYVHEISKPVFFEKNKKNLFFSKRCLLKIYPEC